MLNIVNHCSLIILFFSNFLSPLKLLRKLLRIYYPFTDCSHCAAVSANKKNKMTQEKAKYVSLVASQKTDRAPWK